MKHLLTLLALLAALASHAEPKSPGWPVHLSGRTFYSATHDAQRLYLTTQKGHGYAINLDTGAIDWQQSIPWNTSSPELVDGVLYLPASSSLLALAPDSGETLWQRQDYNAHQVIQAGGQLFARSHDTLLQLDAASGQIENAITAQGYLGGIFATPRGIVLQRNLQYLDASPEYDATLALIDPQTGKEPLWQIDLPNRRLGQLATDDEYIYVATNEPGMAAYHLADGYPAWQTTPGYDAEAWPTYHGNGYLPGKALPWQDRVFFTILGGKSDWTAERKKLIEQGRTEYAEYQSNEGGLLGAVNRATGEVIWEQLLPRAALSLQMAHGKLIYVTAFGWVRVIDPKTGTIEHTFTLPYGKELGLNNSYQFAFAQDDALYAGIDGWIWRVGWEDLMAHDDWRGVIDYETAKLDSAQSVARLSTPMSTFKPMVENEALHVEVDFGQAINVHNVLFEFFRDGEKVHELYHSPSGSLDRNIDSASISLYLSDLGYRPDYRNSDTFNLLMKHQRAAQGRDELSLHAIFQNSATAPSFTGHQSLSYTQDQLNLAHGYAANVFEEISWNDGQLPVMVLLTQKPDRSIPINWLRVRSQNLQTFRDTYPQGDYLLISILGEETE
ncbi:PQQ-binding-like beta-propeller repeat protein [Cerasicoccus fimbriatus]|uniref:outer membrane protein assembly factor BamB family protein n=1 Tax=Cerasicoccus fimbriatus TaxID=3014554 RepID=UPI0022B343AC|nr:PQQ-binding-like beta-propeller repeat protein [Cerasicoccus sp. TK19100]